MQGKRNKSVYYLKKVDFNELNKSNNEQSVNGFRMAYLHGLNHNVFLKLIELRDKFLTIE